MIKKIITLLTLSFMITTMLCAQKQVSFQEKEFDFGKIKQGIPVTHDFVFVNHDNTPLIVVNVQTSCGCTTPKWPQTPILSHKQDKINIGYNAATLGKFQKVIFVYFEGQNNPVELLIKGEVIPSQP